MEWGSAIVEITIPEDRLYEEGTMSEDKLAYAKERQYEQRKCSTRPETKA